MKPIRDYLEFGVRLHLEDFSTITGVVLLIYLPVAAVFLYFHPPLQAFVGRTARLGDFLPALLVIQVMMRVLQSFIFLLLLLKIHGRGEEEESVWDIAEAIARLRGVAIVDLIYIFGLQLAAVMALIFAMVLARVFFGGAGIGRLLAMAFAGVIVLGPAIRYYFCTFSALFRGTGIRDSFQSAASLLAGGEPLLVGIMATYLFVWFLVWQISLVLFGTSQFGQIMAQAIIMVTSISYFFATYRLFLDLCLAESDRARGLGDEPSAFPRNGGGAEGIPGPEEDDPEDRRPGDPPAFG